MIVPCLWSDVVQHNFPGVSAHHAILPSGLPPCRKRHRRSSHPQKGSAVGPLQQDYESGTSGVDHQASAWLPAARQSLIGRALLVHLLLHLTPPPSQPISPHSPHPTQAGHLTHGVPLHPQPVTQTILQQCGSTTLPQAGQVTLPSPLANLL